LSLGDLTKAEAYYRQSLQSYPNYYRAQAGMAQVRGAQKRYDEAIDHYQKAIAVLPMPDYVAGLGDLYGKIGKPAQARQQYELVEYIGRLNAINQVLYNRELAYFYADHDMKLAESLELAKRELDYRKDIYAYDLLGWSLYKNDKVEEARDAIEKALPLGTQDAKLFFHAGMIYHRLGDKEKAKQYLAKAIATNPYFHILYAETAQKTLEQLEQPMARVGMELRGSGREE
jgi:tetratricopeptide (TPR) repeat protein